MIDPESLLYKCWADVGIKNRSIGTLETGLNNFDIMSEFIQGSDNFSDSKCLNCRYLPVCDGRCNLYRVNYKSNKKPYDVCQYGDEGMKNFLEKYTIKNKCYEKKYFNNFHLLIGMCTVTCSTNKR